MKKRAIYRSIGSSCRRSDKLPCNIHTYETKNTGVFRNLDRTSVTKHNLQLLFTT